MLKNRNKHQHVQTAAEQECPTKFALTAASTVEKASLQHLPQHKRKPPILGIDIMGSDTPPLDLLTKVLAYKTHWPASFQLAVFASPDILAKIQGDILRFEASDFIGMEEFPVAALKKKPHSSLVLGIKALKNRHIDALISCGNTGALLAAAKIHLPMIKGITRPALLALVPSKKNPMAVLDIGANHTAKDSHLLQFTAMGIAYQKARGIQHPKFALLNIGQEASKGTPLHRKVYEALSSLKTNSSQFMGNIESRDVFEGDLDVLVTDGFSGNIFLKTAEGIAKFIFHELKQSLQVQDEDFIRSFSHKLNYSEYPGALLAGIDAIAFKCHGNASSESVLSTVQAAIQLHELSFLDKLKTELEEFRGVSIASIR